MKHTKPNMIDISALLDGQRLLMKEAYNNKGRSDAKNIALFVEVGETINELAHIWKYWKKGHRVNWGKVRMELADVLHFILEKGVELQIDEEHGYIAKHSDPIEHIEQFCRVVPFTGDSRFQWWLTFALFRGLLEHLEISWDDMVASYWTKNKINRERQKNGY